MSAPTRFCDPDQRHSLDCNHGRHRLERSERQLLLPPIDIEHSWVDQLRLFGEIDPAAKNIRTVGICSILRRTTCKNQAIDLAWIYEIELVQISEI